MIELNKVMLVGRLTRDPETRYTQNNNAVAAFSIAVNRRRGRDQPDEVAFIDCEAWTKTAEFIQKWFTKGKPILVEGRIKMDRWQDRESGQNRSKLLVSVERASFAGGDRDEGEGQQAARANGQGPGQGAGQPNQGAGSYSYDDAPLDDDLPF